MRCRAALIGIVLAACGGDGGGDDAPGDGAGSPNEPPELAGITKLHNDVRAMVATSPALPPLTWNPQLAATAAAWVAMCRDQDAPAGLIDHNPGRSTGHPYYVGENVFGASAPPSATTAQQAVMSWAAERARYDYASNTCSGTCGHYTQIVWRTTAELGCAIGVCPNLTFKTSLVCDYGPGGNVNNQRPY